MNPATWHVYWFVLPLVLAISFVYSASRYESWRRIIPQSLRLTGMILVVLVCTTAFLLAVNALI